MTQQILHQVIVGLSNAANGMRLIADEIDRGHVPPEVVASTIREMANAMTQAVVDISA